MTVKVAWKGENPLLHQIALLRNFLPQGNITALLLSTHVNKGWCKNIIVAQWFYKDFLTQKFLLHNFLINLWYFVSLLREANARQHLLTDIIVLGK